MAARLPNRQDDQARRLDGYFNQGSERVARRFDFERLDLLPAAILRGAELTALRALAGSRPIHLRFRG